jgi:GH18 family chitinase
MMPMDVNDVHLYADFTDLKTNYPGIRTWISVGGWTFNDATNNPNTQTAFSDMASTAANRKAFIMSLLNFMQTYGFDGTLPGASDDVMINVEISTD